MNNNNKRTAKRSVDNGFNKTAAEAAAALIPEAFNLGGISGAVAVEP